MPDTKEKDREIENVKLPAEPAQEKPRARRRAADHSEKPAADTMPEDPAELAKYKEEKLNALLSSPESMQQVAQLAQMLAQQNGGAAEGAGGTAPPEGPPPPAPAEEPSLASLFGGLDPSSLARFLPLL